MIWVSPDMKLIVTTNVNSGTVSIIEKGLRRAWSGRLGRSCAGNAEWDSSGRAWSGRADGPPGGDWNETVVRVGNGSEGFDVSPDGKEIWVANAADGNGVDH